MLKRVICATCGYTDNSVNMIHVSYGVSYCDDQCQSKMDDYIYERKRRDKDWQPTGRMPAWAGPHDS
jgi:hypothetical protein